MVVQYLLYQNLFMFGVGWSQVGLYMKTAQCLVFGHIVYSTLYSTVLYTVEYSTLQYTVQYCMYVLYIYQWTNNQTKKGCICSIAVTGYRLCLVKCMEKWTKCLFETNIKNNSSWQMFVMWNVSSAKCCLDNSFWSEMLVVWLVCGVKIICAVKDVCVCVCGVKYEL